MLKSQNKYRRLRKPFIFILSIILTFSVLTLEGFKKPYKALSGGAYFTNNEWGSVSYGVVGETVLNTTYNAMGWIYAMNGVYNGRVNINFTNTFGTNTLIIPYNCVIESKGTQSLTISWKNVQEIGVIFMDMTSNYALSIQSMYGWNMTKIANGTNNQLEDIKTQLSSLVSAVNNSYSQLTSIHSDTSAIYTLLQNYFTSSSGTNITIGDIVLQFNEFNAQLRLQLGVLNDLNTAVNNIDNKIDSISWNNITFKGITTDFSTFNASYTQQTLNNNTYVAFNQTNEFARGHANVRLFKLTIPAYASNNDFKVYFNSNANSKYEVNILLAQKTRGTLNVYFTLEGSTAWGNLYPSIVWNGATIYTSPTPTLQYIDNNDIEYWELYNDLYSLRFYNQSYTYQNTVVNKLDDIIDAVNNINLSISDDTITNTENIIEQYNENYTTYHSVENNYINNYQTIDNTLDKTNFDNPINITGAKGVTDSIINKLFGISYFKVIFYLILLGFIVIKIVR